MGERSLSKGGSKGLGKLYFLSIGLFWILIRWLPARSLGLNYSFKRSFSCLSSSYYSFLRMFALLITGTLLRTVAAFYFYLDYFGDSASSALTFFGERVFCFTTFNSASATIKFNIYSSFSLLPNPWAVFFNKSSSSSSKSSQS